MDKRKGPTLKYCHQIEDWQLACAHECGHIVVGAILGCQLRSITVFPDASGKTIQWCRETPGGRIIQGLITAGGMAAEKLVWGMLMLDPNHPDNTDATTIRKLGLDVEEAIEAALAILVALRERFYKLYHYVAEKAGWRGAPSIEVEELESEGLLPIV